jgi:hypothetical protein
MEDTKILKFSDRDLETMKDSYSLTDGNNFSDKKGFKTRVTFKSPTGEVLAVGENLVVFRGRLFTLEKLFSVQLDTTINNSFIRNHNRYVCLWKVGTGGAPLDDPFNPLVVQFSDRDMAAPYPYRKLIPSLGDALTEEETKWYYGKNIVEGPEGDEEHYYFKRMNLGTDFIPTWQVDEPNNIVSLMNTLLIDKLDCRGAKINELGLYIAKISPDPNNPQNVVFTDIELFSRITFDTESFKGNKSVIIEYLIFA